MRTADQAREAVRVNQRGFSFHATKGRRPTMVMGYFDDSGTLSSQKQHICMAGYLADDSNWTALTQDWNVLLSKYSIPFLHLADFLSSWGAYKDLGWRDDPNREQKIKETLEDFIFVIRRHTIAGVGVGLDALAYKDIVKDTRKPEKAQVFCFERVLSLTMKRLDAWGWTHEPICMIFDDAKDYAMRCYSNFWEVKTRNPELGQRIAGIAFGDDKHFAPLQAADFLSYATTLEQRYGSHAWSEHSQFHSLLLDENPAYGKLYDSEQWDKVELENQREQILAVCNRPELRVKTDRPKMGIGR
jgi:hypothetical protein